MQDKDLYAILGVKKEATASEIRKTFHKLAKKHHPDVNPGDKGAEQRFKEINLAYEVLKDPQKRKKYDQMRAAGANPFAHAGKQGGWPGGGPFGPEAFGDFGLGDLFSEIFGSGFGQPGPGAPRPRQSRRSSGSQRHQYARTERPQSGPVRTRGLDREAIIDLAFVDAARGGERQIELPGGKLLTVKIPAGVNNGNKIKLRGQGEPGLGGGARGDLILTVEVRAHKHFRREGDNIVLLLPVTFAEAVLGAEVEIPTIEGRVHLRIPAGVSSGQRLKLAGKGIHRRGKKAGDQLVEIQIRVPKKPNRSYRESAESLDDSFNPRDDF